MMIGKQANNKRLQTARFYLRSSEGGFTIIESLVAILVVSILLVAIAPVLSLSVATRVQSRRIELATQASKSYIDAVKTKKIAAPTSTGTDTLTAYAAPTATGTLTCATANSYCTAPTGTSLYCVDFDGSGGCENTSVTDMIVQGFRYNLASTNATSGYGLGVRVYRADAFKDSTTLLKNTSTTKTTQATFTGGVGQRTSPLVEMTTDINDAVPKYSDLCARYTGGCN
ncbi:MAG: prepilin-type N-terminal cleavage/methylation domain-containing protein [Nostoc sp. NMS1]|uniref:hormogonium polysaccharide secretion pseudopilin HpsB n=1 Tax=unclassified Nostoc TaxID=2593658 RepID=UPI0025F556F3|nr:MULTISPECIES: hormogonium polysaccharide secretion pseudopilin HpsB [unclassified Nostoc]MBN3910034.1 prepilin-type N-terminal cleavage/methylation domain-containing protein [Nostoc sp. NMS1]MBN3992215.1 prepilin-type N-terminal cleavage/methylation domain-containing protein [Nostoc sp. NMS2]